jgi:hypothetical protein
LRKAQDQAIVSRTGSSMANHNRILTTYPSNQAADIDFA